jgi:hypothetical protein
VRSVVGTEWEAWFVLLENIVLRELGPQGPTDNILYASSFYPSYSDAAGRKRAGGSILPRS